MSTRVEIDRDELTITGERSVRDIGNSAAITIPPEMLQGTGLEEGDDVRLRADMKEGTIFIERVTDDADEDNGNGDTDSDSDEE